MITPHINANKKDFSDIVILTGDPIRTKYIAFNWLKDVVEISNVRSMLGFTGMYKDIKVSIMSHGMGIPSSAIYIKELLTFYNVKKIIRLGTCGSIIKGISLKDIIIGMGACTDSSFNRLRFNNYDYAAIADFEMLNKFFETSKKLNYKVHIGNLFSTDFFYTIDPIIFKLMKNYNILGIDMETAGIYSIASELRVQAISICTVSDIINTSKSLNYIDRESKLNKMIHLALESILLF
ncbi:purine-nucleoside phosphorylase [Buchnera aphidicola (Neophyllaphis podocarpi)]|uniref:purine-nucleoside phosphorylase n=1 Tax=Buchnera aphidicola TaxID=9 RepID=UPI0031B845CD